MAFRPPLDSAANVATGAADPWLGTRSRRHGGRPYRFRWISFSALPWARFASASRGFRPLPRPCCRPGTCSRLPTAKETREPKRGKSDLATVFHLPEVRTRQVKPIAADAIKALAASLMVAACSGTAPPDPPGTPAGTDQPRRIPRPSPACRRRIVGTRPDKFGRVRNPRLPLRFARPDASAFAAPWLPAPPPRSRIASTAA